MTQGLEANCKSILLALSTKSKLFLVVLVDRYQEEGTVAAYQVLSDMLICQVRTLLYLAQQLQSELLPDLVSDSQL